jgi:hypothetical protein
MVDEMNEEKCILCNSINNTDSDHIRHSYIDRQGCLLGGYFKPHLTIDEKYHIKSKIGYGEFAICSNRRQCDIRQKQLLKETI